MKPGRAAPPMREITTVGPGSKLVSMPDWEPELLQKPITQPEPGPEKTPTANSGLKPQQGSSTQQEFASQQRPLTQQEPLAPNEAESQQETRAQQKSALHLKFLTPHKSPSTQKVYLEQQEAAFQQGRGPGQVCTTQQEPELRERAVAQSGPRPSLAQQDAASTPTAQATPGPQNRPPAQVESTTQERTEQSDPPAQGTKSKKGFLTDWKFLTRLYEVYAQEVTQEQKTFFGRLTDSDLESNGSSSSETDPPSMRDDGTTTPGVQPAFKNIPSYDYEAMSGYNGTPLHGKKTSAQNHRHCEDTGESNLEDLEPLRVSHPFI